MKTENSTPVRVAVIGAGCSGITTVKNLLAARVGEVVCYEQQADVGGNWIYSAEESHSSVCETTHIISSKRMSEYVDYPMPDDYPDYPSHAQVLAYFRAYARHFSLYPHIRFNTTVVRAELLTDGRWAVTTQAGDTEVFDYLIVANGHHHSPRHPDEVRAAFAGSYLHAHRYKTNRPFADERVLVIGAGNSACDCAVEISRVAERVAISMRRPTYIIPKFLLGRPTDTFNIITRHLPQPMAEAVRKLALRFQVGPYRKYGLAEPTDAITRSHPTLNSELLYKIRHGKVHPRPGILRVDGQRITFADGQTETFDTVVAATGYRITFPFLDPELVSYEEADRVPLYLRMFHPELPTLLFVGLFQPQGAVWPLSDYQAQLAAQYINGIWRRPDKIAELAERDSDHIEREFSASKRHTIEVHYHPFMRRLQRELRKAGRRAPATVS